MNNSDKDPRLFEREVDPVKQGIAHLVAIPILTGLFYLPSLLGSTEMPDYQPWVVSLAMLLLFALINSVLSLGAVNVTRYWSRSIYTFIALCVLGGLLAWLFSGVGLSENNSIRWLYFVFTFVYLLFISIVNLMRKFVGIAQRVDKNLRGESD